MPKEAAAQANEKVHRQSIPTDLSSEAVDETTSELRRLLADTFALYVKTENFHWHMTGQHFRDYHLLLDERLLPFSGGERIGKVETECFLHTPPRPSQVLEMNIGGFLPADLPGESVEGGDEVFKRIADQMIG
jgi:hypothetical protein